MIGLASFVRCWVCACCGGEVVYDEVEHTISCRCGVRRCFLSVGYVAMCFRRVVV